LAAVCDVDSARARAFAEEFSVPRWYADAGEMLAKEQLDLVDIVTHMSSHRALVEMALAAGVATIVQKPFGPALADCKAMTSAAAAAGTMLSIHENFRFQAPVRRLNELVQSGAIGAPNWARIAFRTGHDIYAGQPYLKKDGRFVILDVGTHVLDLARYFMGEVAHVSAETQKRRPEIAGEDTATMLCRHENGAVSVVEATYESRRLPDHFPQVLVSIEGSEGAAALLSDYQIELTRDGEITRINAEPESPQWAERPWHVVQDSVVNTCRHILERYRENRPAETSAEDNLKTFALCEAAYRAAEIHQAVAPETLLSE